MTGIAKKIAPLREVFRLQNADELTEAEKRYLPGAGVEQPSKIARGVKKPAAPQAAMPTRSSAESSVAWLSSE